MDGDSSPQAWPEWLAAVNKVLTEDERKRWHAAQDSEKSDNLSRLECLFLSEVDRKVYLSPEQLEKLKPLMQRALSEWGNKENINSDNWSLSNFMSVAGKMDQKEIKSVLDDAQWKGWKDIGSSSNERDEFPKTVAAPGPGGKKPELPSVEHVVGQYFSMTRKKSMDKFSANAEPRLNELVQIGKLSGKERTRLQTAARGVADAASQKYVLDLESSISYYTKLATPQNVRVLISGWGDYYYTYQRDFPDRSDLWVGAVQKTLSPEAFQVWRKRCQDREDYRNKALAGVVIMGLRHKCAGITAPMADRLEREIVTVLKEYSEDLMAWSSQPWYEYSYYRLLPLAGVPEKKIKDALGEKVAKEVIDKALPNATDYWPSILSNHQSRMNSRE
jgi:hypothetical protein